MENKKQILISEYENFKKENPKDTINFPKWIKKNKPVSSLKKHRDADLHFFSFYKEKNVLKVSNNKFRSGSYIATIKGVRLSSFSDKPAFYFEKDNSEVECFRCCIIK